MTEIVYDYGDGLYINLTNRCPCRCAFCIRSQTDGLGSAQNLWLEQEPDAQEVLNDLDKHGMNDGREVVFCGYGEPLCALDTLIQVATEIKRRWNCVVRINTNGLGNLVAGKDVIPLLEGIVDALSISLNAPDAKSYDALCNPEYDNAYETMLQFSRSAKGKFDVQFSVVDVISNTQIEACKKLAESMEIPLRVRHFTK